MKRIYRRISFACALLTGVMAVLTLVGWMLGVELLVMLFQNHLPMAPHTALAFTLLSTVLLVRERLMMHRPAVELLLALAAVVAVVQLFEYFSGMTFGTEKWLAADPLTLGVLGPGRMSPITALNLLLICAAVFALMKAMLRFWAGPLAAVVLVVSCVVMLGHLHGTPLLYGGRSVPVALPTAAAFVLLAVSVMAAVGAEYWPLRSWLGGTTKAMLLRWFLPAVVLVALAEGLLRTRFLVDLGLEPVFASALSTLMHILIATAVISQIARQVARRIDQAEGERNAARAALQALNRELEQRISERTQELSAKNQQMHEELKMARELQLALLPHRFPSIPRSAPAHESALQFSSLYQPAGEVSGDFFNVFPVSETAAGVFICDVMGHGVRAALVTSMMRVLLEQHGASSEPDPGTLLTQMNRSLHSILKQAGTTVYATAVMVIVDAATAEISYAIAGHPPPLHLRRSECKTDALECRGSCGALGLFADTTFATVRLSAAQGDVVLLFTDGLFEVDDPEGNLYSHENLLQAVQKRQHLPTNMLFRELLAEVQDFSQRRDFDDDVCLVGIELTRLLGADMHHPELMSSPNVAM